MQSTVLSEKLLLILLPSHCVHIAADVIDIRIRLVLLIIDVITIQSSDMIDTTPWHFIIF